MKTVEEIKLKWQKHNRDNGLSWNEIAELVNEVQQIHTTLDGDKVEEWPQVTAAELLYQVCYVMNVELDKARSKSREGRLVRARVFFYLLGSDLYNITPTVLGRVTHRNHATAIHHIDKYGALIDPDQPWYDEKLHIKVRDVKLKLWHRLKGVDK